MPASLRDQVIVAVVSGISGAIITSLVALWIAKQELAVRGQMLGDKIQTVQGQLSAEKMRIKDATDTYIELIDEALGAVEDELNRKEGPSKLANHASRLVETRNQFREALREIEANLDGKFDVIETALASGPVDERQLRQAVTAFRNAWPAKRETLRLALGKFLGVLGLGA